MTTLANPYRATPYILDRKTAPAFWLVGTLWLPMATGYQTANRFSLIEQWMPTGLGPPTHRHPRAHEGFYVLDGTVAYQAGGKTVHAGPGAFIHLPQFLPHSFSVDTTEAHVLNFYAPAGFELCVMSAARVASERRRPSLEESAPPNPGEVRILSKLFGQEEVLALPFTRPSEEGLMATQAGAWSIGSLKLARAADAETIQAFGIAWRPLAGASDTEGTYDLFEVCVPRGGSMPPRILGQDEAIYVIEGQLEMILDGERQRAGEGAFAYSPGGSCCQWQAADSAVRALVFHLPGGFDRALRESSNGEDKVRAVLKASGTRFLAG